jgi:hypothetical protein
MWGKEVGPTQLPALCAALKGECGLSSRVPGRAAGSVVGTPPGGVPVDGGAGDGAHLSPRVGPLVAPSGREAIDAERPWSPGSLSRRVILLCCWPGHMSCSHWLQWSCTHPLGPTRVASFRRQGCCPSCTTSSPPTCPPARSSCWRGDGSCRMNITYCQSNPSQNAPRFPH